jgi:hypothetical protein
MGDVGGQFESIPEANPTTEATANDVVQSDKAPGSSHGHMVDVPAGSSLLWKQRQLEIIQLITSQEDANNKLSVGISVFVERMSTMKKLGTPCIPRAPWWVLIDNSSWCS